MHTESIVLGNSHVAKVWLSADAVTGACECGVRVRASTLTSLERELTKAVHK